MSDVPSGEVCISSAAPAKLISVIPSGEVMSADANNSSSKFNTLGRVG